MEYDWERLYILPYRWMDGIDLEEARAAGLISENLMVEWIRRSADQLLDIGWMVLGHKTRHLIVRPKCGRGILRHHEQTVFGLVDYELLVPAASGVTES